MGRRTRSVSIEMPRARWFVVASVLIAAIAGGLLNARGPFDAHPPIVYDQFLADFEAGRVEHIVQWQNQLEVAERDGPRSVLVPASRDLWADLARARAVGGVGVSYAQLPDAWLAVTTPFLPVLLAVSGLLIWGSAVLRNRRFASVTEHVGRRTQRADLA